MEEIKSEKTDLYVLRDDRTEKWIAAGSTFSIVVLTEKLGNARFFSTLKQADEFRYIIRENYTTTRFAVSLVLKSVGRMTRKYRFNKKKGKNNERRQCGDSTGLVRADDGEKSKEDGDSGGIA